MASGDTRKVILKNTDDEILIPYTEVASSTTAGRVKPDGTTTSVDSTGAMSVIGKQDTLVSGTNIKTVNGNSLLGGGNIPISAQASWGNVTGTLSNQTDLQNALNAKANDSAVVKLTGNQTVAGIKTFTDNVVVGNVSPLFIARSTKTTRGAYNSSQGENKVVFRDKDNKLLSEMRTYIESSDSATSLCLAVVTEDTNGDQLYRTVFRGTIHKNGTSEVQLGSDTIYGVTPATSDNSTKMATTAYVKAQGYALDSAVVKLSGNQTIAGTKTFSSSPVIPTPASSDNSTKAATTAYFRNNMQVVTALPASPTAGVFYFVKE